MLFLFDISAITDNISKSSTSIDIVVVLSFLTSFTSFVRLKTRSWLKPNILYFIIHTFFNVALFVNEKGDGQESAEKLFLLLQVANPLTPFSLKILPNIYWWSQHQCAEREVYLFYLSIYLCLRLRDYYHTTNIQQCS